MKSIFLFKNLLSSPKRPSTTHNESTTNYKHPIQIDDSTTLGTQSSPSSVSISTKEDNKRFDTNSTDSKSKYNIFQLLKRRIVPSHSDVANKPQSKATAGAQAFITIQNTGIYTELLTVASPRCLFQFEGAEFLLDTWIDDASNIGSSYPDFHLSYEKIIDISSTQAMIINLQATGTHTGTPYGFGPYPEIPATNIRCKNDFEDVTVTIDEETGMITCMTFVAKGPSTGPPGFYDQIGGIF